MDFRDTPPGTDAAPGLARLIARIVHTADVLNMLDNFGADPRDIDPAAARLSDPYGLSRAGRIARDAAVNAARRESTAEELRGLLDTYRRAIAPDPAAPHDPSGTTAGVRADAGPRP
ncbi:hypothetical protein OG948_58635 (plasmid) [Embleya sp. NBC_00888]|uniref:hypothetical protein n=1 Tax=Embleya sp. NBC_00888 TaxID=2975960 RepID=UPI002F90EF83|nr:hypothetical protein OG948_58635 [Embleya sp. NBC_00888]